LIVLNTGPCGVGRQVELTASSGTIKSPGYDENSYPNNARCQWLITAPSGKVRMIRYYSLINKLILDSCATNTSVECSKALVWHFHRKPDWSVTVYIYLLKTLLLDYCTKTNLLIFIPAFP